MRGSALARFNAASAESAQEALLRCCGSHRWAQRVAEHRPYPDLDALLAAADEASYDLRHADLAEALTGEFSAGLAHDAPYAAHLALGAAHAEYERKFGHAFVICLDGHPAEEHAHQVLAAIRRRMAHEVDEERATSADELRRVARSRLAQLVGFLHVPGGAVGRAADDASELGRFAPVG
ncbi:2-oxo-4-hydroxy-4-carboxy-5-ureidoimidazoline decarboxylase [Streptomyces sp. G-G2]|uniref:2-oxo-4-hydroxy-4-carboxy-5-ureidoimidazoline decarboxylase n=1 Tax=Streptomyces sp. G-G2 TaxID=3046201 RepID=UPI0024BBD876|nr:2-oxo-4-hydroxy-4-carboxy-5-ureidoimidazoline decarboxylase [Streptomyces sp. G-G2]MDJ0382854.1 2-oxo-4-hydroxy-4-carboxy-5-ureidoimidazoline decarboxylase [Streptomyces sp. G-G2]